APYKRGERCVRNVAVMSDYASIDTPPDPEEVKDSERTTRMRYGRHDEAEKRLSFPQSVRDVVMGSSEIIADDMRFTVSHVVEPVERGIAKVNRTFHQISENVKRFEQKKKRTKDDSYVIPMSTWTKEFPEVHDNLYEGGSVSDSGLGSRKRHHQSRVSGLWSRMRNYPLSLCFHLMLYFYLLQMILKLICALLAMILEACGVYGEGKFQWNYGYPYLALVLNFSQTWALYCLVQFYGVIKDKLAPIKPLAKFLTFKSIVFLTWWQGIIVAFLFSMGLFKGSLAKELKTRIQDYIICIEMGVAAVVHLSVFPAAPYKRGERCVRNVAVMSDYASIDTPPDPEEVKDSERTTRMRYGRHDEAEKRLSFPQSVRDVVMGSSEIIADDMRFTVSHVVEPVERGIAKVNRTFHQISENVKRFEQKKKRTKDDSYVIPMSTWTKEFSEVHDNLYEGGSVSDSGLGSRKRHHQSRVSGLWSRMRS
ncbi:hypothetical protein F2Q69_00020912, partial [Brassica cretica]